MAFTPISLPLLGFCPMTVVQRKEIFYQEGASHGLNTDKRFFMWRVFEIILNSFKNPKLLPKIDPCYLNSKGLLCKGNGIERREILSIICSPIQAAFRMMTFLKLRAGKPTLVTLVINCG